MDTATFLRALLPATGVYFVTEWRKRPKHPRGGVMLHHPVGDIDDAADKALELDRAGNHNVYFAMASYKEVRYKTTTTEKGEFTFPVGRTQDNVARVKCLWMDWDVGKDDEANSYNTRDEALTALKSYLAATGLPLPMIVSSGYGLHTYWRFTEEVSADEWEAIAKHQRVIMRHLGVKFDPSRDRDCASILRPVGTRNKKDGQEPRLVKLIKDGAPPMPPAEYKRVLRGYCERNDLMAKVHAEIPAHLKNTGNLSGMLPVYDPAYAEIVVQHCAQMRQFSETGGDSEPLWYANLGVLKHCEDGRKFAHEWSARHDDYDAESTDAKFDQWSAGPTTCEKFKALNPDTCNGCPHKCRSPVQLGHDGEVAAPPPQADEIVDEEIAEARKTALDLWPQRFGYDPDSDRIFAKIKNPNTGVWDVLPVASPKFHPIEKLYLDDRSIAFLMGVTIRGRVREFILPYKYMASEKDLKMALTSHQIHVIDPKLTVGYLTDYMNNMRNGMEEVDTYQQFGWHNDYKSFLIGDTLLTEREERRILLAKRLRDKAHLYDPSGEPQDWVNGIDALYNRPNGEPYQLAICKAFGAILNPLLGFSEWKGIPLALTSESSGYGKTTLLMLANSIYCKQDERVVVSDATAKGIPIRASAMNHIPFLLDEITKYISDPKDLSDILYALSNGGTRIGLTSDGVERDRPPGWCGSYDMTGNRNMLHHLTEHKLNPEATQMRVFEVDMELYPRIATMVEGSAEYEAHNVEHAMLARKLIGECYGVIGRDWIRFVMKNREEVTQRLRDTSEKLARTTTGDTTKERYYLHLLTCTMVGGYYAKKLGWIKFDLNKLGKWALAHIGRMRQIVKEYREAPSDHFAAFMADLTGKLLVTKRFNMADTRGRPRQDGATSQSAEPLLNPIPNRAVVGRLVLGADNEPPRLYVTVKEVQNWCHEKGVQFGSLRRQWMDSGHIVWRDNGANPSTGSIRVTLGKGVIGYSHLSNPTCFQMVVGDVEVLRLVQPAATGEVAVCE